MKHDSTRSPAAAEPATPPAGIAKAMASLVRSPLYWLIIAVPLAAAMDFMQPGGLWVFLVSGLAIVPLAGLMGRATESLAETLGAGIGGLLNATFGNAAELIIALVALSQGPQMHALVKASITGSIIGNVLLVLGLAIFLGGMRYPRQVFNRTAASMGATLLALAAAGLVMPTIYYHVYRAGPGISPAELHRVESLSEEIAVVLAALYVLSLVFSLHTHRNLFAEEEHGEAAAEGHRPEWSRTTSLVILAAATVGVGWMSELLVRSVEQGAHALGMNQVFVGVIVVAMVGNAAEHSTAVLMALKNRMNLAMQIAIGSSMQIALFVAPVLVFASMAMGHGAALDLHFTLLETVAVIMSVAVLALCSHDGETHWMEGAMLLGLYGILGLAFFNLPAPGH